MAGDSTVGLFFQIEADGSQARREAEHTSAAIRASMLRAESQFHADFRAFSSSFEGLKERLVSFTSESQRARQGLDDLDNSARRAGGRGGGIGQVIESLGEGDIGEILGEIAQNGGPAGIALVGVAAAVIGAAVGITFLTKAIVTNIREVDQLAKEHKLATTQVQALRIAAEVTGESVDDLAKNYKKIQPEMKKFEDLVKSSGAAIDADLRNKAQNAALAFQEMKLAGQGALNTIAREALPPVNALLKETAELIRDLRPAWQSAGTGASLFVDGVRDRLEDLARFIALITGGLRGLSNINLEIEKNRASRASSVEEARKILETAHNKAGLLADPFTKEQIDSFLAFGKPHPFKPRKPTKDGDIFGIPHFDDKNKGRGERDLTEHRLRIAQLEAQAKDAERVFKQESDTLKELLENRLITQEEFANKSIAAEKQLLEARLKVLAAEEAEAVNQKLPNKRAEELLKIQEKEKELRLEFGRAIHKINQDQIKNETEDDVAFAQAKKKAQDELRDLLREQQDFINEAYRHEAEIYDRRQRVAIAFNATFYGRRLEAIRDLAALDADALERQFEQERIRTQREIERLEDINERAKEADAFSDEQDERIEAKKKALNDRLVALEAEKNAQIRLINRDAQIQQEREQPNSDRNILGDDIADALNDLRGFNDFADIQTTIWQELGVAMDAYVRRLRETLPSALQLAVQAFQGLARATTASLTAFLTGKATLRQAVGNIVQALLEPYKQYCETKAAIEIAEAASRFALGDFAGGAKHTAAAALWIGAGALIGAAGSFIAGGGGGKAAGGDTLNGNSNTPQPYAVQRNSQAALGQQDVAQQQITRIGSDLNEAARNLHQSAAALQAAHERLDAMPHGQVVTIGAQQAPGAIGAAVIQNANTDPGFNENLGRRLNLK